MASSSPLVALQAVTPEVLCAALPGSTLGEARKLVAMVHRDEPVRGSSGVRRATATAAATIGHVPTLVVDAVQASAVDRFVKYRLRTADDQLIETVRIPLEHPSRVSVCVSSQVGCALGCAFCATGRLGLRRNLAAWEIVEQVRTVRRALPAGVRVHGVVFQGMGEPMANLDAVLATIAVLHDPCALGVDARAITVCTSGLPAGIRRLAREAPRVRLGLSIGSARPPVRRSLMPIAEAHTWTDVMDACAAHAETTGLAPMWAVTLLDGVNDSVDDAQALADATHAFVARTGLRPRLSVIPYNDIGEGPTGQADPFRRASVERERAFRAALEAAGLPHHKRYSGGGDVAAACGQLAAAGQ